MKLNIDFNTIKSSFLHAKNNLNTLKEYVSSDISLNEENLKIINKIETNIELLINNLNIYNKTNKEYRDNLTLVNMSLSGNISFSLPLNLQKLELVDVNGKKILYETKNNKNEAKMFYQLCNETSNLYQNLLINKNTCLSDERQISVAMLSKDNFEFFKAGEKFESFAIKTTNTLINKRKEEMGKLSSVANGIEIILSKLKNKNEAPTEMNLLGLSMSAISNALMIKSIGGDFVFSAMKVLDKSSNVLNLIKEDSLNKNINSGINDTIREIKINNNEIAVVQEIFSDTLKLKHQSDNGNMLENKIREKVASYLKKQYSDGSLDNEVIKHVNRKKI